MVTKPAAVVVEALDAPALARFWARALEWQPAGEAPPGGAVAVCPGGADGVGLLFTPSVRPKTGKNRLHLDLAPRPGEVRRLLALGASRVDIGQGAVPWEVLADPEGNEFCVLAEADSDDRLAAICLDAADPHRQGAFWAAATGWPVVDEGARGVRLRSAAGAGPALVMGPPVAAKREPNRLWLSLACPSGQDTAAELDRLVAAGASRPAGDGRLLADPEGNEFTVLAS